VPRDAIVPLRTNLPNVARPIHGLVPTACASGHGIKLVHVATTGQFSLIICRLNQAVVANTIILQRFVSSPTVLLSEERPKEDAIDLVQALVREALAGGRRRGGLFDLNDHGVNSRPFGRGARTKPVVQRRRDINTGNKTNGHGYPPSPPPLRLERSLLAHRRVQRTYNTSIRRHTNFSFYL